MKFLVKITIVFGLILSLVLPFVMSKTQAATASCLDFKYDLSKGMSDVTLRDIWNLQTFLINQKYLFTDAPTGYFGTLTQRAVMYYQADHNIIATGYVGPLTRGALKKETCSSSVVNNPSSSLKLTSLSKTSGSFGSVVTIKGTGFDTSNNTVFFGTTAVSGLSSEDGTTLTFTIPVVASQSCTTYSPTGCYISDVDRKKIFGTYQIYVVNSRGVSNILSFTLTQETTRGTTSSGDVTIRPSIDRIVGPSQVGINDQIYWVLNTSVNATSTLTASVSWGDASSTMQGSKTYMMSKNNAQTIIFSHTYTKVGTYTAKFTLTEPISGNNHYRTYRITVASTSPTRSSNVSIGSITPTSGPVGTQIAIMGSGFSSDGNTVNFDNGGTRNVSSYNYGTLIIYSIPAITNGCDIVSIPCQSTNKQILPGRYSLSVTNSIGQISRTYYFNVTK